MSRRLSLESDLRVTKTGIWEIKQEGESEQDHEGTWQQGVSYGKREQTNIHWAHSLTLCGWQVSFSVHFVKLHIQFFRFLSFYFILIFELPLGVNAVLGTGAAHPGFHSL